MIWSTKWAAFLEALECANIRKAIKGDSYHDRFQNLI